MEKKFYLVIAGIIAAALILIGAAYNFGLKKGRETAEREIREKTQQIDELKKRIEVVYPKPPEEIFSISGIIREIKEGLLVVETVERSELPRLPGEPVLPETREVIVTEKTEIVRGGFDPLTGFTKTQKITLADLVVGENIQIESDTNIKGKKSFEAKRIFPVSGHAF